MAVSKKIQTFMEQGSWIRKMFEEGNILKQKYGPDKVFDLSLGNPVVEPPPEFLNELKKIANQSVAGMHRYMSNAGYIETRDAVASQLKLETDLNFTANNVVMTCGAGGALNVVFKTLLNPGEEVLIFAPYFVEYMFYADNHGGKCVVVDADKSFYPDMRVFESSISATTKIVLVSSPNNPTGIMYNANLLDQMGNIIRKKEREYGQEIFLVSDEPYRKILFDGLEYPHIFHHHTRSIVATSHSKDLAIPGERIGFIAIHPEYEDRDEVVEGLTFSNRTLGFVNAPALMQQIVRNLQGVSVDVSLYQAKRDFLYDGLTGIGYTVVKPNGAFYMFPQSPVDDDVAFVEELQEHNILVVPGRGFGMPGHFRISYCVEDRTLEGALSGFSAAMDKYR